MLNLEVLPGSPKRLGVSILEDGSVNFALFSQHGHAVELCLYDSEDESKEIARVRMPNQHDHVWYVALKGIGPGQLYGYRVHGPWQPKAGQFFNGYKLMLDPYAKAITGPTAWAASMTVLDKKRKDRRDSGRDLSKSVVVDDRFDWEGDRLPRIPWGDTLIYEAHVKGFTKRHPEIPENLRGTYAGLASEPAIRHLKKLGVTAIQLLPVHHHLDDGFLVERGFTNYWGYNTVGYFAPEARFSSKGVRGEQVREFKEMVKALHRSGIEVILDVVYNHTGETWHMGPTCCFRGIDNLVYYRTLPNDRGAYQDFTGCGNSMNVPHPQTLKMVLESLRYWVTEMHVDGFRFDLGVTVAREPTNFNPTGSFLKAVHQDPVLSTVKMIAEPWDLGRGGYQVGGFPIGWHELNGKFRDAMRRFHVGAHKTLAEFATRLTGSEDLFRHNGREAHASINMITSHDGFTLKDLVSYNDKHNEANGENNRDGDSHNISWNHGTEGETDDPNIRAVRLRQRRNFLTTMMMSLGVPFICGGDEMGRTQGGNNNAYCQDSEISWLNWDLSPEDEAFFNFVCRLVRFRRKHPVLRRRRFFSGRPIHGTTSLDLAWFDPSGAAMPAERWHADEPGSVAVFVNRQAVEPGDLQTDSILLIFNAHYDNKTFRLPGVEHSVCWTLMIDTHHEEGFVHSDPALIKACTKVKVVARSIQVWVLAEGSTRDACQPVPQAEEMDASGMDDETRPLKLRQRPPSEETVNTKAGAAVTSS